MPRVVDLTRGPGMLPAGVSADELFQSSPDGLVVVGADGTILAVNDALLELLDYSRAALVGQSVDVLVPTSVRPRHAGHRRAFSSSTAARGMGAGMVLHAVSSSGELIDVDIMLGPLSSAGDGCVLAAVRDVRDRRSREATWEHRALHDALTGVANRSLVLDRLEQAAMRAARTGGRVALFFLDLDRFKQINDDLGHAAGDEVLGIVASRLMAETRPTDTIGRIGGDEFVVVVEESGGSVEDQAYAERLRAAVSAPMSVRGHELDVGCSIGAAAWVRGADWSWLMRRADEAMFQDKARRRQQQQV